MSTTCFSIIFRDDVFKQNLDFKHGCILPKMKRIKQLLDIVPLFWPFAYSNCKPDIRHTNDICIYYKEMKYFISEKPYISISRIYLHSGEREDRDVTLGPWRELSSWYPILIYITATHLNIRHPQRSFWVCAQPMRDDVAVQRRVSLAGCIHKMIPPSVHFIYLVSRAMTI